MKKVAYLLFVSSFLISCKKSYTCECKGEKEVVEIVEQNGSVFSDTTIKTIFDSEVFREKNENEAFATCSNKKNVILSELTNSQTTVAVECMLK